MDKLIEKCTFESNPKFVTAHAVQELYKELAHMTVWTANSYSIAVYEQTNTLYDVFYGSINEGELEKKFGNKNNSNYLIEHVGFSNDPDLLKKFKKKMFPTLQNPLWNGAEVRYTAIMITPYKIGNETELSKLTYKSFGENIRSDTERELSIITEWMENLEKSRGGAK